MRTEFGMTGNAEGVVWPPVFAQHGHLAALALTLRETQWLDPDTLAANQGQQLASLIAYHAQHSAWFATRLAEAGVSASEIAHPNDLRRLPVLTRAEAQSLSALPETPVPPTHKPLVEVQSSGSSGIPVVARKTQLTQLMWLALTLRYHEWGQNGPFGRMAAIRPNIGVSPESDDWGPPVALFHKTGALRRISSDMPLEDQVKALNAFKPDAMIAYPSIIAAFLAMPDGLAALRSLTILQTMGETVSPELREAVREATGLGIFDCYSCEEVGYIAVQCPEAETYHVMAESVIVEILRDDDSACAVGETGRVVVTDLMNLAMPFIRYDTGDYAVRGDQCSCGRGLPVIERIAGRWRGMISRADGSRHWPRTGFHAYRSIANVRQYQMIQHAVDRIELRLAVPEPLTDEQRAAFEVKLRETIGEGIAFEIVALPDRLPPGPRGKTDEFISLVGERN
jgi:phenylacetate-CoA ligase